MDVYRSGIVCILILNSCTNVKFCCDVGNVYCLLKIALLWKFPIFRMSLLKQGLPPGSFYEVIDVNNIFNIVFVS